MMKVWMLAVVTVIAVMSMTGCNTVAGMGKDIEKGGEAIQRAVKQ
jgi:entericidin B